MDREQDTPELIELGTASTDTHGVAAGQISETFGFYPLGCSAE